MKPLTEEEIKNQLGSNSDWAIIDNAIERNFQFKDFNEAVGFLTRVALLSETLNHHAEWSGVYNKVKLRLTTHDAGGITEKDIEMAHSINIYIS